jgi:uracil-DNA glycosylase
MTWEDLIHNEFRKSYFQELQKKIALERKEHLVHPKEHLVFRAFELTPLDKVKVVILGQDPYPSSGHAHGLAFSVDPSVRPIPKSLQNIFKEIESNFGSSIPEHGCLDRWAEQGVLMLNTVLTVRSGAPKSHANLGWERFTDEVIRVLNNQNSVIVFIFWGNDAKKKMQLVDANRHLVLTGAHPSPLSAYRGFFGCQHFLKANVWLEKNGRLPIEW